MQLNSGDYRIYKDAANDAGFAFLEYDIMKAGSGILDRILSLIGAITVTDSIEVNPSPPPSVLPSITAAEQRMGKVRAERRKEGGGAWEGHEGMPVCCYPEISKRRE